VGVVMEMKETGLIKNYSELRKKSKNYSKLSKPRICEAHGRVGLILHFNAKSK
jgi:hypothetical protein